MSIPALERLVRQLASGVTGAEREKFYDVHISRLDLCVDEGAPISVFDTGQFGGRISPYQDSNWYYVNKNV